MDAGEDGGLGNESGANGEEDSVVGAAGRAEQFDGVAEPVGVLEIDGADAADAFGVDIGGNDALTKGEGGEDGEFGAGVETVDVGGGVGFGIAKALRFGEDLAEGGAVAFDFSEDVVAGAVQDALEGGDVIAGDAFAQDGMDGDAAGDAGFHGDVDSGPDGAVPNARAIEGHEFLVGGDDGFLAAMEASTISRATVTPPTSSAMMWISGSASNSRQLAVLWTGPREWGSDFSWTERLQTDFTCKRNPSLRVISAAFSARMLRVPEPTLPRPTIPTFTCCMQRI